MHTNLPDQKNVIIGEAAKYLGVSIDTVRRWDKTGILHSSRLDKKNRYFSLTELEQVKSSRPLRISDVALRSNLSVSTIRRFEKKGMIQPSRDKNGERVYTHDILKKFLESDRAFRQRPREKKTVDHSKEEKHHIVHNKLDQVKELHSKDHFSTFEGVLSHPGFFFSAVFIFLLLLALVLKQNTIPLASEVIRDIWRYSVRSLLMGNIGSTTTEPVFIYGTFIVIFALTFLYTKIFIRQDSHPIIVSKLWTKFGSIFILVLSISLGLATGLAVGRVTQDTSYTISAQTLLPSFH